MQEKAEHVISRRSSHIDKQILRRKLSIYQVTLLERGVEAFIPKHVRYSFSGCLKFFLVHDGEAIPVNIDTSLWWFARETAEPAQVEKFTYKVWFYKLFFLR